MAGSILPIGALPDLGFEILDPAFAGLVDAAPQAQRLWTGGKWVEGPAWLARERKLVWSDIPNNRMLAWHEADGRIETFRAPARGANGNTVDREGRLVTCEQYSRRITRTEPDGTITGLVDNFEGRRFNAPNDIVVKSDGSIWFTDPDYGKAPDYEGVREMAGCHVYRLDPASGVIAQVTDDFVMPNGLAFSPDESVLYVIDTGSSAIEGGPNHLRRMGVGADGTLGGGEVMAVSASKSFDGLRIDTSGNLWMGTGEGVQVLAPDGRVLGRLAMPERVSNLTFGGSDRGTLLMTGTTSLYSCRVNARPAV